MQEVVAPSDWRSIDFISDLHLAADHPRTFAAFAAHLRHTPADAVFILGDLFDLWVGDDVRHGDFEARCVGVLAEAASHRAVAFMAGNRDFLVGSEMLGACGVTALADPTLLIAFGQRLLLSHGDALCLSDVAYQRFRANVRDPAWQRAFLALPLAERRVRAAAVRTESENIKRGNATSAATRDWIDVDPPAALRWLQAAGAAVMVHGHTHMPGSGPLAPGFVRHVLSDWDLDGGSEPPRAEVLRWSAAGFQRLAPTPASIP